MIRAVWFVLKLAIATAAVLWLVEHPGRVEIEWLGYIVEAPVGALAALLAVFLFVWTQTYRVWRAFVSVPVVYRRYRITQNREKGYRAVTSGLVAIAAGDGIAAEKYAKRAKDMIPDTPLVRLLSAQTYLMNGNAPRARTEFAELLADDDAAFLGLRGLLGEHLRDRNYGDALVLMRRAEQLQPKRLWVIRSLFDLETRNRDWKKAEATLKKAERLGIFDARLAKRHRQALFCARADDAALAGNIKEALSLADKAFSLDPAFTPAALRLADHYVARDKKRKAIATIERAYAAAPHPALATRWLSFTPPAKRAVSVYDQGRHIYEWMKKLVDLSPKHRDSQRALGAVALEARMWREAREHLKAAQDYKNLAKLEQAESGSDAKAREWLEAAAEHPFDPRWVCASCHHNALQWTPLCPTCGKFDSEEWMLPSDDARREPAVMPAIAPMDVLAPPEMRQA